MNNSLEIKVAKMLERWSKEGIPSMGIGPSPKEPLKVKERRND